MVAFVHDGPDVVILSSRLRDGARVHLAFLAGSPCYWDAGAACRDEWMLI